MSILLILFLLISALFLSLFKYHQSVQMLIVLTIICYIAIGNGWISSLLLTPLQKPFADQVKPQWKDKNVIVLLGAGTVKLPATDIIMPSIMAYSRIDKAARLYFSCIKHHQCTIIISGGDALKTGKAEALVYKDALIDLGVKLADIEIEANSMNTYQNAQYTSVILKKRQFDQVVLVTSGIHLRRALLYFSHFGVHAQPILADYLSSSISMIPLAYHFVMTDLAIHEYIGMIRYDVYNFLGLNKSVSRVGAA